MSTKFCCQDLYLLSLVVNKVYSMIIIKASMQKMAPQGQKSERRLATTWRDDTETNWNRRTDRQDHVLTK